MSKKPIPHRIPRPPKPHLHVVEGLWQVDYIRGEYYPLGERAAAYAWRMNESRNPMRRSPQTVVNMS